MDELGFIDRLKQIATHPAARGLVDDAAMMPFGRHKLVMTHDMMVEGVHFLATADPADVAWKLVAVNLSDLAAKGAKPVGLLLGYGRVSDDDWDRRFIDGLKQAISHFAVPLLGGDTVSMDRGNSRVFGLTAIGEAKGHIVPSRANARAGHAVFVTGTIGDAWAGLQIAQSRIQSADMAMTAPLLAAYNRPMPQLDAGRALSSLVSAMMDISDGLLIDALRIADASGVQIEIDLAEIPLSPAFRFVIGEDHGARISAATGGDDYQLLFTASPETVVDVPRTCVGICRPGKGIRLHSHGVPMNLPVELGYVHA